MSKVLEGDNLALAALVERYHSLLLGYLFRLCAGNQALAEDLVQDTFIRLIQSGSYQAGRAFKPWIYAIATNLARDYFKSAAVRYNSAGETEVLLSINDAAPGPEELALAGEQGQAVARAVSSLPEEYRVTLLLRFYNDLSLKEISETLHIPLGTVKSRLSVGTRRLRELLTQAKIELEVE